MLAAIVKIAASGTVSKILEPILEAVTPAVRSFIVEMYVKLKEKTDATPNEADDALTELIKNILKIRGEEIHAISLAVTEEGERG